MLKTQDLSKYSIEQLDLAWAALPYNNPNKDVIAREIERRVDMMTADTGEIVKADDVDQAFKNIIKHG